MTKALFKCKNVFNHSVSTFTTNSTVIILISYCVTKMAIACSNQYWQVYTYFNNTYLFSIGKGVKHLSKILNSTKKQAVKAFCQLKNEQLHKIAAKRKPHPNKGVS